MAGAGYAAGPDTAARVTSVPPCTGAAIADCYNYIAGIILNITFCTLHNIHRKMAPPHSVTYSWVGPALVVVVTEFFQHRVDVQCSSYPVAQALCSSSCSGTAIVNVKPYGNYCLLKC